MNFDREAEDAAGGFGVVPAPRIKLKGHFPSGLLSPDGMQPLFGLTPFKLVVHGLSEAPKYAWLDGIRAFVPPSAIEAALTAGETLGSAKTEHRRRSGAVRVSSAVEITRMARYRMEARLPRRPKWRVAFRRWHLAGMTTTLHRRRRLGQPRRDAIGPPSSASLKGAVEVRGSRVEARAELLP